jgi:hypothetical protein
MKRFISKKTVAIGLTAGLILGVSGAAFAVWTTTGSGSGSATASSNVTSTVTADASPAADANLYPGGPAVPVHFSINNPNPYAVTFTTFNTAVLGAVTPGTLAGTTCSFNVVASGTLDAPVVVPANGSAAGSATLLTMNSASDNSCQGASVTVDLHVAGSQN